MQRIYWIDYLKGFAIFLVVVGHICQMRFLPLMEPMFKFIYSFHMPLFMFVSGMLALNVLRVTDFKSFIKSKSIKLLPPFLFWGVLNCLLHRDNLIDDFLLRGGAFYWYLWILLWYYIILTGIIWLTNKITIIKDIYRLFFFLIVYVILNMISENCYIYRIFYLPIVLKTYPYFILGFYYSYYGKKMISNRLGIITLISFFAFYYLKIGAVVTLLAIFSFVYIFQRIDKIDIPRLKTYGKSTLYIYVIHYLILALYPHNMLSYINSFPLYLQVILSLLLIIIPAIVTMEISIITGLMVRRLPIVGELIMGEYQGNIKKRLC